MLELDPAQAGDGNPQYEAPFVLTFGDAGIPEEWQMPQLLGQHGEQIVQIGTQQRQLSNLGLAGKTSSLRDYHSSLLEEGTAARGSSSARGHGGSFRYSFDRKFLRSNSGARLMETLKHVYKAFPHITDPEPILMWGGVAEGLQMHAHLATWAFLAHGVKQGSKRQ